MGRTSFVIETLVLFIMNENQRKAGNLFSGRFSEIQAKWNETGDLNLPCANI